MLGSVFCCVVAFREVRVFFRVGGGTLCLLRVGSRSRRLWESPPIPTERYERRLCFCRIHCTCRSSDFCTLRQKRIRGGSTFAERNSGPLKRHSLLVRTPIVSVSRMARRYTIQCSLPNTQTVYIELDDGRQAGREGWRMGGREQGDGGGWRDHERE